MTAENEQHFHWSEGMKYATEGIKSLFYLNGAATISILTFIGNVQNGDDRLAYAMVSFSFGALLGPFCFIFAYLTQLQYGNNDFERAKHFHIGAYFLVAASCIAFATGVCFATGAFISLP